MPRPTHTILWLCLSLLLTACALRGARATPPAAVTPTQTRVPTEFRALYDELDAALTAFDASLDASGDYPVTFATELLSANGNRGTDLFNATNLPSTRLWLDRLYALGVRGVTLSITYPILTPNFPNSAKYLEYYKSVANEVRQRGMKLCVEMGLTFPRPFSTLDVNYRATTFEQFKAAYRQMALTILTELQPDYLDLGAEPDTFARISGWRELNTPQGYADVINFAVKDLHRGTTKIGAGIGTWGNLDFVRNYVTNPALDFVAIHIYPVTDNALPNAVIIADLAHQHNKRVIVDEAWLYKASANDPVVSIAANADIFRRDAYSFWAPLDQKFITLVAKLARAKKIEYVSIFWAQYLYAYVD
ncbi:MAG: hypothetical protein N2559_15710, partial [Anaerolineae bacterium]|nr:hypothetical protein [Anaerolineae bacterium]